MHISILTYNILFNKAKEGINSVMKNDHLDIVCFQEIETKIDNLNSIQSIGYKLADYSNSFIKFGKVFGLATYYNPKTLTFINSESFNLPKTFLETLLFILKGVSNPRSVLKTEFITNLSGEKLTVYNIHLYPWGSNGAKLKQIKETLNDLKINIKEAVIIAGDFNYPYARKKFENLINIYHLYEATNNIYCTLETKILGLIPIRWKLDYILFKNIKLVETKKISLKHSDHYPIMATFDIA